MFGQERPQEVWQCEACQAVAGVSKARNLGRRTWAGFIEIDSLLRNYAIRCATIARLANLS